METLARLEETTLSIWLRESGPAFFGALTLHSLAMGFVVGINIAVALKLIGFVPRLEITAVARFFTFHWYGVAFIFISGIALLLAYPAKALTNPVFYFKLCALSIGLLISRHFQNKFAIQRKNTIDRRSIGLAYLCLALWIAVVTTGRFLAYTHTTLLASRFY
ncbi:MAG: hypothetical protein WDZ52_15960 [Pseudohongiellaceae bacterium]